VIADRRARVLDESSGDDVLDALAEMVGVLHELNRRGDGMIAQAELVVELHKAGGAWEEILVRDGARRLTAMLADSAEALGRANSSVRRAQATALYANGLSMERIANLLAISRQRVAVLLNAAAEEKRTAAGEHGTHGEQG
jgi:hypothetical protein